MCTNEEKAREIAKEYRAVLAANTDFDVNDLDLAEEDATRLTLDMAEWKDHQFREYIETHKQPVLASETDDTIVGYSIDVDKISHELFKED